ncbi:unnamed protein product [Phaeothamnion confervicola]
MRRLFPSSVPLFLPTSFIFLPGPFYRSRQLPLRVQLRAEPDEVAAVAGMSVKEIKKELQSRGVPFQDLFEKNELVERLADARTRPRVEETGAARAADAASVARAEVAAMSVRDIKGELDTRGVSYRGLFEKGEVVELLLDARAAAAAAGTGDEQGSAAGPSGAAEEAYDSSFRDVEGENAEERFPFSSFDPSPEELSVCRQVTLLLLQPTTCCFLLQSVKRMTNRKAQQQESPPRGGVGGGGGGGIGGMSMEDLLGGMGMGGMGPRGRRRGGDFGGGGAGQSDLLNKIIGNPKAMAAFQRAQRNSKVMSALQDVMKNGIGALGKYQKDPDIRDTLNELKDLW